MLLCGPNRRRKLVPARAQTTSQDTVSAWRLGLFTEVPGRSALGISSPEIASWYIRSTPSEDMIHLLHKKGRRSDHLSTPTLLRKEQEDGPNSRARH
jgi:hypothetical protein